MKKTTEKTPKKRDENAKNKKWQVPVKLESATPEEYPERHEQTPK